MRILMVNKFLYPNGGSETYIFRLGEELKRQGHEVTFFGMEHEGNVVGNAVGAYTSDMDFHSGKLSKLTYPFKIIYSREARRKIRKVLDSFHPDVVHLNNINFQITPSIIDEIRDYEKSLSEPLTETADGRVHIVFTAHDYQWICPNHMMRIPSTGKLCTQCTYGDYKYCTEHRCIHDSKMKSLLGTMEAKFYQRRGTYREVDRIVCPSEFLEQMFTRNPIFKDKTVTLHNFIEEDLLKASEGTTNAETSPYVLYYGRYAVQKGVRTLLSAVKQLPEIDFVFAGKGELKDEITACEHVREVGFLTGKELMDTIRKAAFVVFPSEWYENCPFTVMETQTLGVPIIASDLGGTPELIDTTPGEETGELFPGGDADALAGKIHELWNDSARREQYATRAKDHSRNHFDTLSEYVKKLVVLYQGN